MVISTRWKPLPDGRDGDLKPGAKSGPLQHRKTGQSIAEVMMDIFTDWTPHPDGRGGDLRPVIPSSPPRCPTPALCMWGAWTITCTLLTAKPVGRDGGLKPEVRSGHLPPSLKVWSISVAQMGISTLSILRPGWRSGGSKRKV
jgi:hypothetical protein